MDDGAHPHAHAEAELRTSHWEWDVCKLTSKSRVQVHDWLESSRNLIHSRLTTSTSTRYMLHATYTTGRTDISIGPWRSEHEKGWRVILCLVWTLSDMLQTFPSRSPCSTTSAPDAAVRECVQHGPSWRPLGSSHHRQPPLAIHPRLRGQRSRMETSNKLPPCCHDLNGNVPLPWYV